MPELTERQKQVMNELIKGYTNEQIADALGLSSQTVNLHLLKIYRKWNMNNRNRVSAAVLYLTEQFRNAILQGGN